VSIPEFFALMVITSRKKYPGSRTKAIMRKVLFVFTATILLAEGCNQKFNILKNQPLQNQDNTSTDQSLQVAPLPDGGGQASYPDYYGVLKVSDNPAKGNLMLLAKPDPGKYPLPGDIAKDTTLYIQTQRDYSNLIGKKVLVGFLGDVDSHINSFKLIDIIEYNGQINFSNH